jgi:hypothetical protein
MATPGDLIRTTARALNVAEVTVGQYYRRLREGDAVTRGGRGRSAPRSTFIDASRLLIALMASDTALHAHSASLRFWGLRASEYIGPAETPPGLDVDLMGRATFDCALAHILKTITREDVRGEISDEMWPLIAWTRGDGFAEISFAGHVWKFDDLPDDWVEYAGGKISPVRSSHREQMPTELLVQRTVGGTSLLMVAATIGG